ncbi:MAG: M48 family metallopeptidase [Pseudomonadota bacterium]
MKHTVFIKKFLAMGTLALMLALALAGCQPVQTTQPGTVGVERKQLMLVSQEDAERAGEAGYAQEKQKYASRGALNTDKMQYQRVTAIARNLIPQTAVFRSDAPGWKWEVNVFTSKEINAYCMPGGKIGVYTGLLNDLKLTDDEVAIVMGHEIAHALREHSREQMSRAMSEQVLMTGVAIIAGMSPGQLDLLQKAATVAITLPHSRKDEREADRIGLELAARAGYDPRASISVWKKMQAANGSGPPQFLSTHPAPESRIDDLEALIPAVMPLYEAARRGNRR